MSAPDIAQVLPHRYPFLLVDRCLEVEVGRRAKALKNVSHNEPFFVGHFPGLPVMPGVLIIEAMAQTAALAAVPDATKVGLLAGVDAARLRRMVVPGDQLVLEAELGPVRRNVGRAHCRAYVGEVLAAEADILFALRDRSELLP